MNPTQLGPYTITTRLGRGGMGTVFEAVDSRSGATVAVKMLSAHLADDPGLRRRFNAEIEALKSLRHPGIVRLLAFGEQDDQPYFAMELVKGQSLEQLLRGGRRFTWRETLEIAAEIARALKVAHDHGVIHRDLKPANLLVIDHPADPAPPPDGPRVKLADFGIAKLFGGDGNTALGNVVGTVEYMAPEQAAGRPVDQRADLYALGLVMYAMLAGAPPFQGRTLTEIIGMQQRVVPPRIATIVKDVPPEFDEIVARLLAKDPAQRPTSALALTRLLAAVDTVYPPGASATRVDAAAGAAAPAEQERGPTAHDRGNRPTRPIVPAAERPGPDDLPPTREGAVRPPAAGRDKDAESAGVVGSGADAPTVDLPGATSGARGDQTAATGAWTAPEKGTAAPRDHTRPEDRPQAGAVTARSESGPRSPGDADGATPSGRGPRNRFMTVEELDELAAAQARRERTRERWIQWAATAAVLAGLPLAAWLAFRPPSADRLHARIMAVAREYDRSRATADRRDDEAVDLRDVRDDARLFLDRHAADPRAEEIRGVVRELDLNALETRVRVLWDDDRKLSPVKQEYHEAVTLKSAAARLAAIEAFLEAHGEPAAGADADEQLLPALARRTADRLRTSAEIEAAQDPRRAQAILDEAAALDAQAAAAADADLRDRLTAAARRKRQSVVSLFADDPHARPQVEAAKRMLAAGAATASPPPPVPSPAPTTPPERPRDAAE
jgi:hypothetical protein